MDTAIRTLTARINRDSAPFNALSLKGPLETEPADRYQTITDLQRELDKLKTERKPLPKRVPIGDRPESERLQRLLPERSISSTPKR